MPRLHHLIPLAAVVVAVACATASQSAALRQAPARSMYSAFNGNRRPLTRAERTNFQETSRYADVVQFIDSLKLLGAKIAVGSIGKTSEGRELPYVIASRPLVSTPTEAQRLDRPIVYVQGNIHAGEVEGKEALLSLVRDLVFETRQNVLDSIVLIVVPIYNADGNERFAPQARNRGAQNGPEMVGTRQTAQGINLNRDYMHAAAPETRASLAMFRTWDPDVFIDLHTTDGSFHGYALTYAGPLNPASFFTGAYTRDSLLPVVRERMRERQGFEVYDYGDFASQEPTAPRNAWTTYDHTPRYGTNYYGLRGRISILSEAFSHDPFARRVASTYDFVYEILSLVAEKGSDITDLSHASDRRTTAWGDAPGGRPLIPLRARLTTHPRTDDVLLEVIETTTDSVQTEPGVRRGRRRTGRIIPVRMPVFDRFEPSLLRPLPFGYAFRAADKDSILPLLQLHGIDVDQLVSAADVQLSAFTIDSVTHPRGSEGHNETLLGGRWSDAAARPLPGGTYIVRAGQPLGILAAYLLEPESDDGLVTWNLLDRYIDKGREFPIMRIEQRVTAALRPVGK
jgi:hypothetical protein